MTITAVSTTAFGDPPPPRRQRIFEDERWLAMALLVPTVVLLGLFIAYPFVRGIMLSVTDSRVGVPGNFVGFANYTNI
jgi:multiple sugar transport system permease protein